MDSLHFDIRDIFRAVRLGWSGKKIWAGLCGMVVAYAGYSVLVTVAHLVSGATLSTLWHRYGLFPGAQMGEFGWLGTSLHVIGMLFALAVVFLSTCLVCKITYQQLRGDDFFSSGDAWGFLKGNWRAVLLGPIATLALFVFFVIAGIIIGWLAKVVPVAGELLFALTFIPIFFAALMAVFIAITFVVALMMSPAVVGTVGEDALEVVIQSFSMAWSQPWRLVIYVIWLKISVWVGVTLLGSLAFGALWLISWACGMFMDLKLANMLQQASYHMPAVPERWDLIMDNLPTPGSPSGAEIWGGRILGVMLILLTGVVLAYGQAVYASGMSLIYVILRKRKDDENLLEWEIEAPDETLPEAAEPVADAEPQTAEGEAEPEPDAPEKGDSDEPEKKAEAE